MGRRFCFTYLTAPILPQPYEQNDRRQEAWYSDDEMPRLPRRQVPALQQPWLIPGVNVRYEVPAIFGQMGALKSGKCLTSPSSIIPMR
jgi:hypothetical protein